MQLLRGIDRMYRLFDWEAAALYDDPLRVVGGTHDELAARSDLQMHLVAQGDAKHFTRLATRFIQQMVLAFLVVVVAAVIGSMDHWQGAGALILWLLTAEAVLVGAGQVYLISVGYLALRRRRQALTEMHQREYRMRRAGEIS